MEERKQLNVRVLMLKLLILIMIVVVGGYFRLTNLTENSSWHDYDEGVHSQAAILYIRGYMPYEDFLFMHPPLILYILNTLYRFYGANLGVGRMFSAILSTLTIIIVYFIGRKSGSSKTGYIASAFVALNGYTIYNSRKLMLEPSMNFFTCLSFLAYILSGDVKSRRAKDWLIALSGILMALSISTKMVALFNWIPLFIYMVWRREKRALCLFALSSLVSVTAIIAPFLTVTPDEFMKQILLFHMLRPPDGIPKNKRLAWMIKHVPDMIVINLGLISLAAILVERLVLRILPKDFIPHRINSHKSHVALWILWVTSILFMFSITKSFYGHYVEQIIPPFALLIGSLADDLPRAVSNLKGKGAMAGKILKVSLTLTLIISILAQFMIISLQRIPTWENMMPRTIANELIELTAPEDRILVFEPLYAFIAERAPAGLMCDSYGTMLYIGLGLHEETLGSAVIRAIKGQEAHTWPMHDPKAQEYIMNLVDQSDYVVIGDWRSRWQLTQETLSYIHRQTSVVKDLGNIQILAVNSSEGS